jgi:hypothetical protein
MEPLQSTVERLTARVRAEYREMPGLALTFRDACWLWQMDPRQCVAVLRQLLNERFLYETARGAFVASPTSPAVTAPHPTTAIPAPR